MALGHSKGANGASRSPAPPVVAACCSSPRASASRCSRYAVHTNKAATHNTHRDTHTNSIQKGGFFLCFHSSFFVHLSFEGHGRIKKPELVSRILGESAVAVPSTHPFSPLSRSASAGEWMDEREVGPLFPLSTALSTPRRSDRARRRRSRAPPPDCRFPRGRCSRS